MTFSGANAQNNTAGTVQASVPGKPVVSMPATNLNIGMDLWNASPASTGATKLRPTPPGASSASMVGREGVMPEQWIQVRALLLFVIAIMYLHLLDLFNKNFSLYLEKSKKYGTSY